MLLSPCLLSDNRVRTPTFCPLPFFLTHTHVNLTYVFSYHVLGMGANVLYCISHASHCPLVVASMIEASEFANSHIVFAQAVVHHRMASENIGIGAICNAHTVPFPAPGPQPLYDPTMWQQT